MNMIILCPVKVFLPDFVIYHNYLTNLVYVFTVSHSKWIMG